MGHSNPVMTRQYSHTGDAESTQAVGMLPSIACGTTEDKEGTEGEAGVQGLREALGGG